MNHALAFRNPAGIAVYHGLYMKPRRFVSQEAELLTPKALADLLAAMTGLRAKGSYRYRTKKVGAQFQSERGL